MEKEYLFFDNIKDLLRIKDESLFQIYIKEVYKDLSDRAESDRKTGISKLTFIEYMKLPIVICEKLFAALDNDNDNFLNSKEFTEGLLRLYTGSFNEITQIIFDMLDFDKDGHIHKGDMKIILSYLPIKNQENVIEHKFQLECLNEIDEIINETFSNKNSLDYNNFVNNIQSNKSDVFVQILCFLYVFKPFSEENILTYQSYKKRPSETNSRLSSPNVIPQDIRMPSPNRKSRLLPAEVLKIDSEEDSPKSPMRKRSCKVNTYDLFVRMSNTNVPENNVDTNHDVNKLLKHCKSIFESPSRFYKKTNTTSDFKLEDNMINMNIDDQVETIYENWLFKLTDSGKLKKYWIVLLGKDIYYYKSEKKDDLQGMHNLSGCFIKDMSEKVIEDKKFYTFSIIFSSKIRNYYSLEKEEIKLWIEHLKETIGYHSFTDFYDLFDDIGEGKFGTVKLGIHKKTSEKVAIKIIKKTSMTVPDMELVRSEIDIMKLCKHPNIVRLLDHFENSEYIFIVMEYLQEGEFASYIKKKNYKFCEESASKIMYQIGSGIKYLHDYGILHRDLKPENIMLSSTDPEPVIKVMDFGLSKILGPNEKVADGYGTLSFVAPEVLIRQPYNKQIDIWSMGIILFYMLSGLLPFDDENDDEEAIAKKTVFSELEFPDEPFNKFSFEVKDLIRRCLIKDPLQRLTVEDFLTHKWIKKYNT